MDGRDLANGLADSLFRSIIRIVAVVALVALLLGCLVGYAFAQQGHPVCGPLDKYLADYKARFGETPFWSGVSNDQKTRTIFLVNPNSGTWTVAIARIVEGLQIACTAAGGTDFMPIPTERHMNAPNKQADGT